MKTIAEQIRISLEQNIDEKTLLTAQHFFKEKINVYGVKIPTVHKISKDLFAQNKQLSKNEIWQICTLLFQSGNMEESFIACDWSYFIHKKYEKSDFETFTYWIENYINNWASCDTLCNHSLGEFLEMYPDYVENLKTFALSGNRWMRRAAAVSLIIPARKGLFQTQIFEIADLLLQDKDDLVQKGYGWMLKACSEKHQQAVFEYVMLKKQTMPRTALRYAIEKMPKELKTAAMMK